VDVLSKAGAMDVTFGQAKEAKLMGIKEFAFKPLAKNDIAMLIRKVLDVS
jgi:hypothetical protein